MAEPGFIQLIEFTTDNIDEIEQLVDEWAKEIGARRTALAATICSDRDKPRTYVQMVEFPSYERAMANSNDPVTSKFAARLRDLSVGEATFRNLNVTRRVSF